jgi:hypothetical protein
MPVNVHPTGHAPFNHHLIKAHLQTTGSLGREVREWEWENGCCYHRGG